MIDWWSLTAAEFDLLEMLMRVGGARRFARRDYGCAV